MVLAEACGPAPYLDWILFMRLTTTPGDATACATKRLPAGGPACASTAPTSPPGSRPPWMVAWIASQQDSLAAILAQQGKVLDSAERAPAQRMPAACVQLTLGDLLGCSWKIAPESSDLDGTSSPATSWRGDTAGATESLPRLILVSEHPTGETAGTASHAGRTLPTLTVCGNYNFVGASATSGDGLATALKMLPTLCATDSKSPYSAAGYARQTEKRSKPLRDTALHTTGIRLTPAFCLWWMGWPVEVLAATRALGLLASATHGSRFKRLPPGESSAAQSPEVKESQ